MDTNDTKLKNISTIDQLRKTHVLQQCNHIEQICAPLQKYGIRTFFYVKFCLDGSQVDLTTNQAWTDAYFSNMYSGKYSEKQLLCHYSGGRKIRLWALDGNSKIYNDGKENFNAGNGITLSKNNNGETELFYFCSTSNNIVINQFYLNNLDFLEKFTRYFKEKADPLICQAESEKLIISRVAEKTILPNYQNVEHASLDIIDDLNLDNDYEKAKRVTKREKECLHWLVEGKTAEEIAMILSISKRTVEAHIFNLKNKLNCFKLSRLIYVSIKCGLISL